jgi:formate dehydrogenase accessory protein FdhD
MRTPGHDEELAAGFLFTEGVITGLDDVAEIIRGDGPGSTVEVELRPSVEVDLGRLARRFYTSSSCRVCGKTSIAAVQLCQRYPLRRDRPILTAAVVHRLPEQLRLAQAVFDRTGGLHAAALFDPAGRLLCLREDVGRHNAVDKVLGAQLLAGRVPLNEAILLVSGRASFELVQKGVMAGGARPGRGRGAVQPGRRSRPRPGHDRPGIRPGWALQHLQRVEPHSADPLRSQRCSACRCPLRMTGRDAPRSRSAVIPWRRGHASATRP